MLTTAREQGDLLRTARHKLGLSQANFALALGVKPSRYGRWERGETRRPFTHEVIRRFQRLAPEVFRAFLEPAGPVPLPVCRPVDVPFGEASRDRDDTASHFALGTCL